MVIELNSNELKELVKDSYELISSIPKPKPDRKGKYEIASRSKLKNLPEALREFEDAQASVTHFVKSASYFLPRSDSKLSGFLTVLLEKVKKIQKSENDPERVREKIRYLIGYSNWGMDAVCNIFTETEGVETEKRIRTMIGAEFKILGADDDIANVVDQIMKWKEQGEGRRR